MGRVTSVLDPNILALNPDEVPQFSSSVSDPYSCNPDPAKNLNPDLDPSYFLPLSEIFFITSYVIIRFSHQK